VPDGHWLQLWQSPRATPRLHLALGAGYFLGLRRKEIASLRGGQVRDDRIWRFVRKGGGEDTLDWRAMLGTYVELLPQLAPGGGQWGEQFLAHARDVGTEGRMFWTD